MLPPHDRIPAHGGDRHGEYQRDVRRPAGAGPHPEAAALREALDGHHRQADCRHRGREDLEQGGNAVDAACAMIAATATAWTTLSWGGETQALIYNPNTGKVIAIEGRQAVSHLLGAGR